MANTESCVLSPYQGTIGNDRAKWPKAFTDKNGATYMVTQFEGFDPNGLAKMRIGGLNGPPSAMDIGAQKLSAAERSEITKQLADAQVRAPLLMHVKQGADGKPIAMMYVVDKGNAQNIEVHEILKNVQPKAAENKLIMDSKTFESAMRSLEAEIAGLKLDKTPPRPAAGQSQASWLDSSVNQNINQAIDQLKARGIPYQMGAKGDLGSASALDCSGFASAVMRKVGTNLDASTGQHISQVPGGTAADMVEAARRNGGSMTSAELLRNPRPGCLIGLSTGAPHGQGRPNGVDHVALTFEDKDKKMKVAEFVGGKDGKGGLRVSDLGEYINKYEKKGAGVFIAGGPEAMCNRSVLAQAGNKKLAEAQVQDRVEVAEAEEQEQEQDQGMRMG